ncbi:tumor necrosis factor receptor superfamily member 5 precursor [Gasterosteus aculeatus]|nr:tumor necrosis factor receptor superfamily member 5 precursor [Gasterosteus aculeatus]ACL80203.1 CD40 [Gasterosteus aculeatus]
MCPQLLLPIVGLGLIYYSALTAAAHGCDPLTQYEKDGECCKMCGPGTRMSSSSPCLDPQCTECPDGDYQDVYTSDTRCNLQPYCDRNKNFKIVVHKSKKVRSTCICNTGFHCSSEECITCVPHARCKPGHGAQSTGNHTHNTVCQKCTEGTFSEDTSWDGVCQKWTKCPDGLMVEKSGTDVSDNTCVASRSHAVVIVVGCLGTVCLLVIAAVAWFCLRKGRSGDESGKVKKILMGCFESRSGDEEAPVRETRVLITNPTEPAEEESLTPELLSTQEEAGARTPEENEDELSLETPDLVLSENGNFVTQEKGKSSILSRQESQTQTFTT